MFSCEGPFVQRTLLLHNPDNSWVSLSRKTKSVLFKMHLFAAAV